MKELIFDLLKSEEVNAKDNVYRAETFGGTEEQVFDYQQRLNNVRAAKTWLEKLTSKEPS